jgi:hypothetical protein
MFNSLVLLMQTQVLYLVTSCVKLFAFNAIWSRREILNGNCSRFCDGQILRFQQLSIPSSFSTVESKGVPRGAPGREPGPVYNNDGDVKGKRGRRHLGFLRGAISLSLKVLFLA